MNVDGMSARITLLVVLVPIEFEMTRNSLVEGCSSFANTDGSTVSTSDGLVPGNVTVFEVSCNTPF